MRTRSWLPSRPGLVAVAALLATGTLLALAGACSKRGEGAHGGLATLPPIDVREGRTGLLFTYADGQGSFETTDGAAKVPEKARARVRVVDPEQPIEKRTDLDVVYVTDLRKKGPGGTYPSWVLPRAQFEAEALALRGREPPLADAGAARAGDAGGGAIAVDGGSAPADGGSASPERGGPVASIGGRGDGGPGPAGQKGPAVILYSTRWCGVCKRTRAYLEEKKIHFVEKDIERDPEARRELLTKASKVGLPSNRVPVLDVRGRLLLGFDPARLDALLGREI